MKIFVAGVQLTDWGERMARDATINGQTVVESADIVRALAKRFLSRGNDSISFQFGARWEFDTLKDAQNFFLTGWSALPKFGLCQVICGGPGDDDSLVVSMPNAVLSAMPQCILNGVEVVVQFTIQAGIATTTAPIDLLAGGDEMILRGKQAIASGVDTVAVAFVSSFPAGHPPIVNANVSKPNGGSNIVATIREDLVTVDGFTAELSGPTPDGNHKLHWSAYST
jgi:hypothetical protein